MNKYTKHTPGPWELSNDHKPSPYVIRQVGRFGGLASVKFHGFNKTERAREEQAANARLIAAAPDLLDALEEAIEVVGSWGDDGDPSWLERAKSAIAKVGGAA
jgi:hypothetical protein